MRVTKAIMLAGIGIFSIAASTLDASAQRARHGSGLSVSRGNAAAGTRGFGPAHPRDHSFAHRSLRHRHERWLYGGAGINGVGYVGSDDNCVFEQRLVWNGWATMREVVTVCQ